MLKTPITVVCHANVAGPNGRLFANNVYVLDDSEYVRTLIKSENVSLVDPPSLDATYLERAGFELCDGYTYEDGKVIGPNDRLTVEEEVQIPWFGTDGSVSMNTLNVPAEDSSEKTLTAAALALKFNLEKPKKVSEESSEKSSEENDDSQEGGVQE